MVIQCRYDCTKCGLASATWCCSKNIHGRSCRVWCGNLSRFMKLIDNYWWQQSVVLNLHLVMATLV